MDRRTPAALDDKIAGTVAIGDLEVRRLGFGAMRISAARNADGGRDRGIAVRLCRRAADRGVNFVDTANIYGYGQSEEILAEALYPYPNGDGRRVTAAGRTHHPRRSAIEVIRWRRRERIAACPVTRAPRRASCRR
jgi:aryl-alcohol dehydrogenase-like predicted oxidoreductase